MNILAVFLAFAAVQSPAAPNAPCALIERPKVHHAGATTTGFGVALAADGDRMVVGQPFNGRSWVFRWTGTLWNEEFVSVGSVPAQSQFGHSVDIDGTTFVAGAPKEDSGGQVDAGAAYVYWKKGPTWSWEQQARLTAPNPVAFEEFGYAVALLGDTLAVGAPWDPAGGAVQVYTRNGTTWTHQVKLTVPGGQRLGLAVALDGETLLSTSVADLDVGRVAVFVRLGTSWSQQQLIPKVAGFGHSLDLEGDRALIGSPLELDGQGRAYVYERVGTVWSEEAQLEVANGLDHDEFGLSVALAGERAVVGSPEQDENGLYPGSAFLFRRSGTDWVLVQEFAGTGLKNGDAFGRDVDMVGGRILAGAPAASMNGGLFAGAVCPFDDPSSAEAYCTAGTSASGCRAALTASGLASASAPSGFTLLAAGVEGAKDGILFWGVNGRQAAPWGNGTSLQCVVPPVSRGGLLPGTGSSAQCDGAFAQDLNARWCATCPRPGQNPGAGATVQAQLWYRDPLNTAFQTTSLSNALEFAVCP